MKKYLERVCLLLLIMVACSCASQPVAPPSEWRYEKEAIHLHLKADSQLNLYDGTSHTLLVCVYQLKDPNAFNQLTEDNDGLHKLLECGRFDPSVASSKRFIIYPGQDLTLDMDRAEGARYVAVVGGYYRLQKYGMVRIYDVPWAVEEKGFIRRTKISRPAPLNIDLVLGSQQLYRRWER